MPSADNETLPPKDCLGCKATGSAVFAALSAYAFLEARRGSRLVSPGYRLACVLERPLMGTGKPQHKAFLLGMSLLSGTASIARWFV